MCIPKRYTRFRIESASYFPQYFQLPLISIYIYIPKACITFKAGNALTFQLKSQKKKKKYLKYALFLNFDPSLIFSIVKNILKKKKLLFEVKVSLLFKKKNRKEYSIFEELFAKKEGWTTIPCASIECKCNTNRTGN